MDEILEVSRELIADARRLEVGTESNKIGLTRRNGLMCGKMATGMTSDAILVMLEGLKSTKKLYRKTEYSPRGP
jgi:tetrahydromethanopterin S-methyltransferase subunit F